MCAVAWALLPSHAVAIELPEAFEQRLVVEGLDNPTAFTTVPDGRIFVAEKGGTVRVVRDGALLATPVLNIGDRVAEWGDRGLLGIAADADFATNRWLYLLYTYDTDPTTPTGPKIARLTRVTVGADNTVENPEDPETVILGRELVARCPTDNDVDCIPADAWWHSIGTVRADPRDGTLWVGVGDAAHHADSSDGFRAQDPSSLAGKVLHVDRDGRGLPGHPLCATENDLTKNCTKVHSLGFRNPFRFTLSSRGVVVGDVGSSYLEEVNLLDEPGHNYGWPCREGGDPLVWWSTCESRTFREAIHTYEHQEGASVTGGPLLDAAGWPASYLGSILVGDYVRGTIERLVPGEDGAWSAVPFADDVGPVVDLQQMPDGDVMYVDLGYGDERPGALYLIAHAPGNRTPVPALVADRRFGPIPMTVNFDASASTDPDGDDLSFSWDFEDDGNVDAVGARASTVFEAYEPVVTRLTVSDGETSAERTLTLWPGNTPPQAQITSPVNGVHVIDGGTVMVEATGHDVEDGELTGCQLRWQVIYHHGDHRHVFGGFCGRRGSFLADNQGHGSEGHYELQLTARDNVGAKTFRSATVFPQPAAAAMATSEQPLVDVPTLAMPASAGPRFLKVRSVPSGAPISVGSRTRSAPFVTDVTLPISVAAAKVWTRRATTYVFRQWNTGPRRSVRLAALPAGGELVASFRAQPGPALLARNVKLGRGRKLTLRLSCARLPRCAGTLTTTATAGRGDKRSRISLGSARFGLRRGERRTVRVRVPRRSLRALRRRALAIVNVRSRPHGSLGDLRVRLR